MTSKYQKTPFNKSNLLKMESITAINENEERVGLDYKNLKLDIINGQLCFVTPEELFMPIARISTVQGIIENYYTKLLYKKVSKY
jgi:hypothetical protein